LAVRETGDRGQAYSRRAEPFCLRLVSFLAGHVTSKQPWYGLAVRETGDRGQAYSRRAEPFCLRLVSKIGPCLFYLFFNFPILIFC